MGGEGSGNIPGFRWEAAEMSGKGPEGGSNGKGERGPTSRLASPSRAGAPFRHTPACSDRGRVELDWRRGRLTRPRPASGRPRQIGRSPHHIGWIDRQGAAADARAGPTVSGGAGSSR